MNLGPGGNIPMNRFNNIAPEQPNPLFLTYQNPQWAPNAITPDNVLHYFCDQVNPFYERASDNEQLKMQNMGLQNFGALNQDLTRMNGTQYVLQSSCPPLYVICKHKRNNPNNVTPLCYYYVLNGTIYQAPDLYSAVQSRLVGAVEPLKKAMQQTLEMSRFNMTKGYSWDFKTEPAKGKKKAMDEEDGDKPQAGSIEEAIRTRATPYQTVRTEMLLRLLHEQFPSDSQPPIVAQSIDPRRPASSIGGSAPQSTIGGQHQQQSADSPFPHSTLGPSSAQEAGPQSALSASQASNLELPQVLPTLLPGVSQMANDALGRLQAQVSNQQRMSDDNVKMEVDSTND